MADTQTPEQAPDNKPLSPDEQMGAILVEQSYVSQEELEAAKKEAAERVVSLKTILTEKGLFTQALYESALAEHYKMPFYDIRTNPPEAALIAMLPEDCAREYHMIVVKRDADSVTVATSDPGNPLLEEAVRLNLERSSAVIAEAQEDPETEKKSKGFSFRSKKKKVVEQKKFTGKVEFVYASKNGIESCFTTYRKPLETRFQKIIEAQDKVAPEILEEIFSDAIDLRASDIHFEPQEGIVIVRFRVDGVMHEAGRIPREHYEGVVNRIKIEGNMRIDEHFAAQDGAIRYHSDTHTMDVRVSIVPVVDGEKIVMRLLSEYVRTLTLSDLGFSAEHQAILTDAANKPFGMILTTGPTGSGKSTTLYGLLKMRNKPDVNISTIEDPVEYKIPGINHIQTNANAGLTFAKGLRALVRQDPDIILVGEIRDGETADISVNAALTGHLLFSTLHANDAATAVPRLVEMGVEPFLLASTIEVVIGQRLVRRLCNQCRYSYTVPGEEAVKLFPGASAFFTGKDPVTLYKGKGCEACGGTGYRGRIGIYELMEITDELEKLIMNHATSSDLNKVARSQGMKLMFEDGFEKVKTGMTTLEELMRVAPPPAIQFKEEADGK